MIWRRLLSLRTRLFWLVLLTLAPAIFLHVVSTLEKRDMARSAAENNLKSITDLTAGNTRAILQNAGEVLNGLTRLPEITSFNAAQATRALNQAKGVFPTFADLTLLRLDGSIAASTNPAGFETNYADRPWVRQALSTKSLAIGGFQVGKRSRMPGLALARPVLDAAGEAVGVCMLALRPTWFSQIFEENGLPEKAEACLFDDRGIVLAVWPDNPQSIGTPLPDATTAMTHGDVATGTAWTGPGPDGTPYYFVATAIPGTPPVRLHLRLGLPAKVVIAPLREGLYRDMLVLGLTLTLALLAAHLFVRAFVLRPTQQLAQMAKAMADGDLDRRSGMAEARGEMADLGRALDAMADTLRERIRFTQEIIDAIPAPLFYKDLASRYLGCNKTYERDIRPLAAILGKTSSQVANHTQADLCTAMDRKALGTPGTTIEYETEIVFQDGTSHVMVIFKSLFNNAQGEPAGIVGMGLDITARKRSEMALLTSETKFRALLDSMRDGFVVVSQTGHLVESNPAFREMLGYSEDDLARMTYRDITPEAWHAAEETLLRSVDIHGFSGVFEKEYCRSDGSILPVALRLHRYPARTGDNRRYFAIVRDISDVKTIEVDLRQAKEAAETASRAKSDFLAKMSHEIRTPLNAVIGMTELTLGTELSGQQRDALETVRESAGNLLEIINDILDISRIEARKLEVARENFDLRRTLAAIIRTMRPQAARRGLFLGLSIDPQTPRFVLGDQVRLRQILLNLIGNSLKFTERGRVTISVHPVPKVTAGEGTSLEFAVADTGVGIAADKLGRIFEIFTQADVAITNQYGGTGLGLAICRELTRLMGGCIKAESTPGLGSVFCVTLPLAPGQAPSPRPLPRLETLPSPVTTGASRPLRILLAEDNPVNIKVAATYLSRRGHDATVAQNGQEALEWLSKQAFDLVLMDVEMPRLDGLEATRRLRAGRAGPKNQAIPVIAMTAHALNGAMQRCLAAGMTEYLPKPLDFHMLDTLLEHIVPNQGMTAPPPASPLPPARELDTETALLRLGGDAELLQDIQKEFLRQYPRKLRLISLCRDNENWSEAALAAHSLKNIAGAVGAEHSRILAGHLEEQLRRADAPAAGATLASLNQSLIEASDSIRARHIVPG